MHAANQSTSDSLGRYYTNSLVGSLLISTIKVDAPNVVVDLGAGDGALTTAAARIWSQAQYFTVDIDKNAGSAGFSELHGDLFKHHVGDALSSSIEKRLGLKFGSADIALCNPPYIRPKWRKNFGTILEDAGLSSVLPKLSDVSADILFIAQNLRFLKPGGRLGLILPDGFIAGERFAAIRKTLAKNHCIERVIELPRRIFNRTEAKAHIVVLSKATDGPATICVQRLECDGQLSIAVHLPREKATLRLDYSYLSGTAAKNDGNQISIRDVASKITRGNISSAQRADLAYSVIHTTDIDSSSHFVRQKFLHSDDLTQLVTGIVAKPGDILIGRVGRNLEEKVCLVRGGNVVVSDCLFILRVDRKFRLTVFRFLKSPAGQKALSASTHGVGARFLTRDAILNIYFKINNG